MKFDNRLLTLPKIFIFTLLITLIATGCTSNQQEEKPDKFVIGIINLAPVLDPCIDGFKAEMTDLGYVEGENVTYIYDGPIGNIEGLDAVAQSLVDAKVDLILAVSTPAVQAVQRATVDNPIPIVFVPISDPVGAGLVDSLAEPGGHSTGVTFGIQLEKRLEWLLRIVPDAKRIYIPYNDEDGSANIAFGKVQAMADDGTFDIEVVPQVMHNDEEIVQAAESLPEDIDAIFLLPDNLVVSHVNEFAAAALKAKLPTSAPSLPSVDNGVLIAFTMDFEQAGRQVGKMANRILKGSKPADMPVETTEFFLAINLATADAIGVTISDDVLSQADKIVRDDNQS